MSVIMQITPFYTPVLILCNHLENLFIKLNVSMCVWRVPGPGIAGPGLQSSGCRLQSPDGPRTPLPGPWPPQGTGRPERQKTHSWSQTSPGHTTGHLPMMHFHSGRSADLQSVLGEVALVM